MEQPFECQCGTPVREHRLFFKGAILLIDSRSMQTCLRYISGARYISVAELSGRGWINPHIWELIEANREKREEEVKCTAEE